jgi:hypothetical protein
MRLSGLIAGLCVLGAAGTAAANPYEAFIDVESEEDLYDLLASQQITEETFNTLIDLFHRGVDLNTANRAELYSLPNLTYDDVDAILAYRKEQGFIRDPAELVAAEVLTDDKLLSIAAFLLIRDPFDKTSVRGMVWAGTQFTIGDDRVPPVGLRTRVLVGRHLTVGAAAAMTRLRPGQVVYDPNRDALLVDEPGVSVHLPKAYVHYDTDEVAAIAGTYRIGFGQRLTFDASSDYTPNGIYRDDQLYRDSSLSRACNEGRGELDASPCSDDFHYITGDFRWREALLGVAAGAKQLRIGDGWLQAYGWASFAPRSIYQYELADVSICEDPRDDDDPACSAPDVFIRPDGDRLQPTSELQYSTLPNMFGEALVGGNATYFASRRNYVGITAYGAKTKWLVDDAPGGEDDLALDFQEWAARPIGGDFGAVGVSSAIGVQRYDFAAEVAHSFDSMPDGAGPSSGGGGPAVLVRATYTEPKHHELEISGRYYDIDFVNPYGRPIAAPDEEEGQRARDELGGRVRFTGRFGDLGLRTGVDLWTNPSTSSRKGEAYVRADVTASKKLRWGIWLEGADKDLRAGGRDECYDQPFEYDELGEPLDCKGMRISESARLRAIVNRRWSVQLQLQHELLDDQEPMDAMRQDVSAWVSATWKPRRDLRVTGRVRYLSEDVSDPAVLEESLWSYLETWMRVRDRDRLRLRADLYWYLDDRDRTQEREPSPELWLSAQYEAKF